MYGPWTRVDRLRRRGQRCRMIGKQGSSSENGENQKKKTWKEVMKEKQDRERGRSEGGNIMKKRKGWKQMSHAVEGGARKGRRGTGARWKKHHRIVGRKGRGQKGRKGAEQHGDGDMERQHKRGKGR